MPIAKVTFTLLAIALWPPEYLFADYTIVMQNDRRITVKEYWEEGGMLKFPGLGGKVGIQRGQIQAIFQARDNEPQGIVVADLYNGPVLPPPTVVVPHSKNRLAKVLPVPKVRHFEVEDQAEEDYQMMYGAIENQIELRRDLFWLITRGTTSPEPTLINSLRVLNARIDDLMSRLKDAEYDPTRSRGTGIVNLEVGSPFAGRRMIMGLRLGGKEVPGRVIARPPDMARPGKVNFPKRVSHYRSRVEVLPEYTYRQSELSTLRAQLLDLYEERRNLIGDMRERGLFTGFASMEDSP